MTTKSGTTGGTGARWYILHTYSGQEDRVQKNLEQRVSTMDVKDKIFEVIVPTEEEVEIKEGERKIVQKKMYAGYLIVHMIMDDESWYVVRNTPGVTGFISAEDEREKRPKPVPLEEAEVDRIMSRMKSANGPSLMRTDSPRSKPTRTRGASDFIRLMILSTSASSSGTGFGRFSRSSSAEIKPVTPGVLRTTYHDSSSMIMRTIR